MKGDKMNSMISKIAIVAVIVLFGFGAPLSAEYVPIFDYNFPASGSDLSLGAVTDLSPAGNDGFTTGFFDTGLSPNVPDGMTGNSVDFGTNNAGKRITLNQELVMSSQAVADNGGYVFDAWFYCTSSDFSKARTIITYSGQENLRLERYTGQIGFNIGGNTVPGSIIKTSGGVEINKWYHAVGIFDTLGNEAEDDPDSPGTKRVYGEISLYVDAGSGLELIGTASDLMTVKRGKSDDYNNATPLMGIGLSPYSDTVAPFYGLIYNPKVSFLGNEVPEPGTFALLAAGLFGLAAYAWKKRK